MVRTRTQIMRASHTKPNIHLQTLALRLRRERSRALESDAATHTVTYWSAHAQSAGEAVFVPDPSETEEDDGALVSVVLDGFTGRSYLVGLDAKDITETGRASLETAVDFGFHGAYIADKIGSAADF